jgi:uncharacterized surface protein with fasciclin (FAS1) repeats
VNHGPMLQGFAGPALTWINPGPAAEMPVTARGSRRFTPLQPIVTGNPARRRLSARDRSGKPGSRSYHIEPIAFRVRLPCANTGFRSIGVTPMIRRTFLAMTVAASFFSAPAFAADMDIVDTAVAAGSFTTLAAALGAAGLVETLKGPGPFTVFAPTDAAFAALPAGTVEDLLKPENKDKLIAILTYHVVPGAVMSTDLTEGMMAATVNGAEVTITLEGGAKVNGAVISAADIVATNGVIHVIDSVILPPM